MLDKRFAVGFLFGVWEKIYFSKKLVGIEL